MARKAVFHLRYRNHTTADPAYARKPTAAELQKGIHNLVQVLSIVKMFIFFFLSLDSPEGFAAGRPQQYLLFRPETVVRSGQLIGTLRLGQVRRCTTT